VLIDSDTKKTGPEIVFPVRFFLLKICRAFWYGKKIGVPVFVRVENSGKARILHDVLKNYRFSLFSCVENSGLPEFSRMY